MNLNFFTRPTNFKLLKTITKFTFCLQILLKHFTEEAPAEVSKILQGTLFKYIERSVYITRSANEFLFSGFRDVLLDTVWMLSHIYPAAVPNIPLRFAWFYKVHQKQIFFSSQSQKSWSMLGQKTNVWSIMLNGFMSK